MSGIKLMKNKSWKGNRSWCDFVSVAPTTEMYKQYFDLLNVIDIVDTQWLDAIMHEAITWAPVDPDLSGHMVLFGQNEFTQSGKYETSEVNLTGYHGLTHFNYWLQVYLKVLDVNCKYYWYSQVLLWYVIIFLFVWILTNDLSYKMTFL